MKPIENNVIIIIVELPAAKRSTQTVRAPIECVISAHYQQFDKWNLAG